MKNLLKRILCIALAVCVLAGTLSGCDTLDTHIETVQTWEDVEEIIKAWLSQKVHDATDDIIETWKETFEIIEHGIVGNVQKVIYPYDKLKKNPDEWEPVLTSYMDHEKLVVSRKHDRGFLWVSRTVYLIELFENDVCIGYAVTPSVVCDSGWLKCNEAPATLEEAVEDKEEGTLVELYPYMRDVFGYLTINKIQDEGITHEELKTMLFDGVFSKVIENQYNDIQSNAMGSATDICVSFVGDATGAVLQTDTFISEIYELKGSVDEAVEVYTNTGDYREAAEYYDPVIGMYEEGFGTMTTVVTAPLFDALFFLNDGSILWNDVGGQTFTKDGKKVRVYSFLGKVKWMYEGGSETYVWEEHDGICTEKGEVQFMYENGKVKWKHWLSDTDIALSVAQRAMHEKAREVVYPVE